ncbi:unnamed protein product [Closterium sp. Yama58-4]|nr:unnamed protein product [Closterium sp. Yama58-4]
MAEQQAPNMQGMTGGSFNAAPPPQYDAPLPQSAPPPPAPAASTSNGCCANNKRSALYTWLPFGLRIGIFFFCLVAFSLCFATKATVTSYSAGAFLVGMTILGFIFAVMLLVYNSVRICVAGSEAYDWMMDIVQFFESYIMSLLLFAAATSGAAACNTWWNTSALNSTSTTKAMLASLGLDPTLPSSMDSGAYLNTYINDMNSDLSKVRGACAMAFFAAFIYIAMFWYYTIRMYKRCVLKAIADAAPAAVKDNVPPYNV